MNSSESSSRPRVLLMAALSTLLPSIIGIGCRDSDKPEQPQISDEAKALYDKSSTILTDIVTGCNSAINQRDATPYSSSSRTVTSFILGASSGGGVYSEHEDNVKPGKKCDCDNTESMHHPHLIPEETSLCRFESFTDNGDQISFVGKEVKIHGLALPLPSGSVIDSVTGSTSDNDGEYLVEFVSECDGVSSFRNKGDTTAHNPFECSVLFNIDPNTESANVRYQHTDWNNKYDRDTSTTTTVEQPSMPIPYRTVMELRERALKDTTTIRLGIREKLEAIVQEQEVGIVR
jgi:hypothetical protein